MDQVELHPHAALIDALGGPAELSRYISKILEKKGEDGITPQAVSVWKQPGRGIAYKHRNDVARLAKKRGIKKLPAGF